MTQDPLGLDFFLVTVPVPVSGRAEQGSPVFLFLRLPEAPSSLQYREG